MADWNKEMYQRDFVELEMHYTGEYGEETVVHKKIPTDWLGLTELEIVNEAYTQFLSACGFYIHPEDEVVINRFEK